MRKPAAQAPAGASFHSPDGSTFCVKRRHGHHHWKCDVKSKIWLMSIDAYLCEKHSCQISSRSNL